MNDHNWDVSTQVAEILKVTYRDNPEVDKYKITKHKRTLSSFIEDPWLWLRLLQLKPPDGIKGGIHQRTLKKRLELLKEALGNMPDLVQLASDDRNMQALFASFIENNVAVLSSVNTVVNSSESLSGEALSPTRSGVVTDLWALNGAEWVGSVTCRHPQGQVSKGYQFDSTSPMEVDSQLGTYPIHIGDEVSFSVVISDQSVAPGTLQVTKYNTCLKDDFVARYFEWILSSENTPFECITRLLDWPVPWMCLLTEGKLYTSYFHQILGVYDICTSASEVNVVPRLKHQLMGMIRDSQFILNMNKVLANQPGTLEGEQAGTGSKFEEENDHITEEEDAIWGTAINLLTAMVKIKRNDSHLLAGPLKEVSKLLETRSKISLMQTLLLSVVDTHMVPTATTLDMPQTWRHVPTIPSNEEFQKIVKCFEESKSLNINLPEVKNTYTSEMEYGHTYFSLLRADCYYPLCEKIARLKAVQGGIRDSYYEMTFMELFPSSPRPILFEFRFKGVISQTSQPDDDPCLTHGNLLCLSLDGKFEGDLIWATVEQVEKINTNVDAYAKRFKEGIVRIQLCSDFNALPDEECMEQLRMSNNVLAVESPAYFRAYQPVLDALKELDLSRVHFLDDFLCPTENSRSPCDLLSSEVDPTPLFKSGKSDGLGKRSVDKMIADLKGIDHDVLCLDPSQMRAVYQSLTTPVSLIQGPPGTGKTYVGVKLMQLFLSLSSLPKGKPILIMAFRNRALDQFLTRCLKFCSEKDDVVRIGRYSEGYVKLAPLILNKKVHDMEAGRIVKLKDKLQSLSKRIKIASHNIVKRSDLSLENSRQFLTPGWLKSLLLQGPKQWLPENVSKRLKKDPEGCLKLLLLKPEAMMGREDSDDQHALITALGLAWEEWARSVRMQGTRESAAKTLKVEGSGDHSDGEDNRVELENERKMASDEEEEENEGGDLNIGNFQIGNIKELDDADLEDVSDRDVWKLPPDLRRKLIIKAVRKGYSAAIEDLKGYFRMYDQAREKYESAQCRIRLNVLRNAKVVGMTTTGAAIHQQLLNQLKAEVVFVEEAAEVLESNLLAALTPHVKHLILIGDHMQLKPKISCNRLKKQNFEKSLFQRLIENGFPHTLLMNQSRMRPEMVSLYSHQYKEQKAQHGSKIQSNKEVVDTIKSLSCMETSVFWWSHNQPETSYGGGLTTNSHEVKMVVSLCLWILSHSNDDEISKDDIAILSPYRAQVKALIDGLLDKANSLSRAQVSDTVTTPLSQLKVYTVDEFQGHEARVIILSLVRSNTKGYIGFLSDRSRQVVAVSRQKCGLYIVGDSKFLKEASPLVWKPFLENREAEQLVKDMLTVQIGTGRKKSCKMPEDLEKLVTGPPPCDLEADSPIRGPEQTKLPNQQHSSLSGHSTPTTPSTPISPQDPAGISSAQLKMVVSSDVIHELEFSSALPKWKHLGRRLHLSDVTIEQLEKDYPQETAEQFHQMMVTWKKQNGNEATYERLFDALKKLRLQDAIDQIKPLVCV